MRILFVHPAAEFSIGDVGRGYRTALERQGHEISDYFLSRRLAYHQAAMPKTIEARAAQEIISRHASETILNEAMYHQADLVLVISGLNLHPIALWLLGKLNFPVAVIFTESPYDDVSQEKWASLNEVNGKVDLTIFTNDEFSAKKYGWHLLKPSYDPAIHCPQDPDPQAECDVLMIGTGWPERQTFLEAVNWKGIHLKLYGIWPGLKDNYQSPLFDAFVPLIVNNSKIASMYCAAKICLNFHRTSALAKTPGPRAYEIAACGAFQLSDPRPGMQELFEESVPTFSTPRELEARIRYYLEHEEERHALAAESRRRVQHETFDVRATELVRVMDRELAVK